MSRRGGNFMISGMNLLIINQGKEAQPSETTAAIEEDVPLADLPSHDANKSPPSEGASKLDASSEKEEAVPNPGDKDAPNSGKDERGTSQIDPFNALSIANDIAKKVAEQVSGGDAPDPSGTAENIGGVDEGNASEEAPQTEKRDDTMNAEAAEEIESPVQSLGEEPPPFNIREVEHVVEPKKKGKKKKLGQKSPAATTSVSRDQTPSSSHVPPIINIPSSAEKEDVVSKVTREPTVSGSSEMDDLAEDSEEGDEADSGEPHCEDKGQHKPLPEIENIVVKHEGNHGVSSFVLPSYALLSDSEGDHQWRIRACSAPILHAFEKQYPQTFAHCTAGRLVGGTLLDLLAETVVCLQRLKVKDFSDQKFEDVISSIDDMETFGIKLGWLREYLQKVHSTQTLFESYFKIQNSKAKIAEAKERYNRLLAEAKEQISALKAGHELLVKEHQALEAVPKVSLSGEEPILPQADLIAQKLSE